MLTLGRQPVQKPEDIPIGPQWCADPSFHVHINAPENALPPPRRILNYQTHNRQEYVAEGSPPDEEETKYDEKPMDYETESIHSEDDNEIQPAADDYSDAVDIDELS